MHTSDPANQNQQLPSVRFFSYHTNVYSERLILNKEGDKLLSDIEIMELLISNPEKGLEELMNTYMGLVYTIVYSKLSGACSKEDIEECVSDIFYNVYKNYRLIDLSKGTIKAYLSVMAKRRGIDMYRRVSKGSEQHYSIDEMDYELADEKNKDAETVTINSETKNTLINEIKALGEPDSEIFIRKYFFGQSSKLIARALKLKVNTVDKKVSRGLQKLKISLGGVL